MPAAAKQLAVVVNAMLAGHVLHASCSVLHGQMQQSNTN
jgi:hypothetical protein